MSPWRTDKPVLGLDGNHLAWRGNRGGGVLVAELEGLQLDALAATLRRRETVDIVVASAAAAHWIQPRPSGVASLAELRDVAAARCAQLHGGSPDDWWIAADWQCDRKFACVGIPLRLVNPLAAALEQLRVPARWRSAWALAVEYGAASFPEQGWCGLRSPGGALLWHLAPTREVNAFARLSWLGPQTEDAVEALAAARVRLACVRDPTLQGGTVHWLRAGTGEAGDCEDRTSEAEGHEHIGSEAGRNRSGGREDGGSEDGGSEAGRDRSGGSRTDGNGDASRAARPQARAGSPGAEALAALALGESLLHGARR